MAAKHILHYLQGTMDFGLDYRQGDGVRMAGYTDSDWAVCASDRKSTSRCCFGLGSTVSCIEFNGSRVHGSLFG